MNTNSDGDGARDGSTDATEARRRRERIDRIRRHREKILAELRARRAEHASEYDLPLRYPARVVAASGGIGEDDGRIGSGGGGSSEGRARPRTSPDFVNARLLEAGVPLGASSSPSSLGDHSVAVGRFIRDLEGTGCYDAVQVHVDARPSPAVDDDGEQGADSESRIHVPMEYDVAVRLREKNWYRLYVGGGINADDVSTFGAGGGSSLGPAAHPMSLIALPKLQFETSASLLNLTGFTDVSSASYFVDQMGSSTFRLAHDRPLASYLPKGGPLYDWLMPRDPRTVANDNQSSGDDDGDGDVGLLPEESEVFEMDDAQYSLGGGSQAVLGLHAAYHDIDHESTRSSREFVRSVGARIANHSRGASRTSFNTGGSGGRRTSTSPPESMAGPYLFLDWSAALRDVLPARSPDHPFVLNCSREVAESAGTRLKHSLAAGLFLNGCFVDDRYDPTMGYDAHLRGEVAGPPGDVGFWKVEGGCAWHFPLELLRMMVLGVGDEDSGAGHVDESPSVIGPALHSSFGCGILRPLTFGGLLGTHPGANPVPLSDRFHVGGPGQLRGFLPSGIGPRAWGGTLSPGGDALGGDLFYASTLALSAPFPPHLSSLRRGGARLFGFANAGTCVSSCGGPSLLGPGCVSTWGQILQSTRAAVGAGVSMGTPMGRLEATYSIPIRYGPRDARKSVQFGFGFSFG